MPAPHVPDIPEPVARYPGWNGELIVESVAAVRRRLQDIAR
jgi:hypothetical protein